MTKRRRRFKQIEPLEDRLAAEAERLREKASNAPPGKREELLRKARQFEEGLHMSGWLRSPGVEVTP